MWEDRPAGDPETSRYALALSDGEIHRYRFMAQLARTSEAARRLLDDAGLPHVDVQLAEAWATGLEPGAFDVVCLRHVLAHNTADEVTLRSMGRNPRPARPWGRPSSPPGSSSWRVTPST